MEQEEARIRALGWLDDMSQLDAFTRRDGEEIRIKSLPQMHTTLPRILRSTHQNPAQLLSKQSQVRT